MSENNAWQYLRDRLKPHIHIERFTDRISEGVPDTCYVFNDRTTGWLELKYLPRLSPTSKIPWKSPAQPLWLNRWTRKGGVAGILMRTGDDEWLYWRAEPDPRWCGWISSPKAFENPHLYTQGLQLDALLVHLRK